MEHLNVSRQNGDLLAGSRMRCLDVDPDVAKLFGMAGAR
jgi:hypothetical protein